MGNQNISDVMQHRFSAKRLQEKDDERAWDAGNREPWTASSSRASHLLEEDFDLFSRGIERVVAEIRKATTVGLAATITFFVFKILLDLGVNLLVSIEAIASQIEPLARISVTVFSITASFKITRELQMQVFQQLFADRLYETVDANSEGQIERDAMELADRNRSSRRLILPVELPSGESRFQIGTVGVQVAGDDRILQVDWKRVEDIILFSAKAGRLVSGQQLRRRVEDIYTENSDDIDVAPTVGLRLSNSINYNDFGRLFSQAQEAYRDLGSSVDLIRIVLRDRAEEGERRHHSTLGEQAATNVSEEIIIPTRFFSSDPSSNHMDFFFKAVKFMIVRQNPNNFS